MLDGKYLVGLLLSLRNSYIRSGFILFSLARLIKALKRNHERTVYANGNDFKCVKSNNPIGIPIVSACVGMLFIFEREKKQKNKNKKTNMKSSI